VGRSGGAKPDRPGPGWIDPPKWVDPAFGPGPVGRPPRSVQGFTHTMVAVNWGGSIQRLDLVRWVDPGIYRQLPFCRPLRITSDCANIIRIYFYTVVCQPVVWLVAHTSNNTAWFPQMCMHPNPSQHKPIKHNRLKRQKHTS
jgi:hypothetical protein